VLAGASGSVDGQAQYVGIPKVEFDAVYAEQENSEWCWAASIQMILNYYGINISQAEIVARSYGVSPTGDLPDWSGSWDVITANLNNWSIDDNGTHYVVSAAMGTGPPPPALLVSELSSQRPVLVAYMSSPQTGHAVVATAVSYAPSMMGPIVASIIVRDPWPSPANIAFEGHVEYPGSVLARDITAYWIIRVASQ